MVTETKRMPSSCIYGPVRSWRLGNSLGVDLLCIDSICSFECVYCQLGKINNVTTERQVFVSTKRVLSELQKFDWQSVDVITFSGSGEPTLAANLGEVIADVKATTEKPCAVLTNSSLLSDASVRDDLSTVDKVFCKLDAWNADVFRRVDRPHHNLSFENVIKGLKLLRTEFKGFMALQTMILSGMSDDEIDEFAQIISDIKPDEVQLNLPLRPIPPTFFIDSRGNELKSDTGYRYLRTISKNNLEGIRQKLSDRINIPIITR